MDVAAEIFRAYDIRGVVGETLTTDAVYRIGRAYATLAAAQGQRRVAVGGDGRDTTPQLCDALGRGLTDSGADVVDIGTVPTPLLYYATHTLETGAGIMVTGSHNPPEYNGLKMVLGGRALTEQAIQGLRQRIERGDFASGEGALASEVGIIDSYIDRVAGDVTLARRLRVAADCGNGVAGLVAPRLLAQLGCDVIPLYATVDGSFPNHHPDPAEPANLSDLIEVVRREKADVGIAFDGDGDRLGVVTDGGEIVWPDRAMMLFARDIASRRPGARIVFDVKCSRHLPDLVRASGGEPIMCRTGHSHIKAAIRETGAAFGGEFSGHLCFAERWFGFDDALYSAARLLEILAAEPRTAQQVFAGFPEAITTPEIKIPTTEQAKFAILDRLAERADFGDGEVTRIDGIRVDYADGWGLVRPSNTSPMLTLRFEADSPAALAGVRRRFDAALRAVDPGLALPP